MTLLVNLLCISERFSSTLSVKTAISEALKFRFRAVPEIAEEAILQSSQLAHHGNIVRIVYYGMRKGGLNGLNPRLANLSSNRASNNAILTAS